MEPIVFTRSQQEEWVASQMSDSDALPWRDQFSALDDEGARKVFINLWLQFNRFKPMPVEHTVTSISENEKLFWVKCSCGWFYIMEKQHIAPWLRQQEVLDEAFCSHVPFSSF